MLDDRSWLAAFLLALGQQAPARPAPLAAPLPGAIRLAPVLPRRVAMAATVTPQLLHAMGARDPDLWAPPLAAACADHGIDTPLRLAAFLANVMAETGRLSSLVESLNYTPEGLLATFRTRFTPEMAHRLGRTPQHPADQRGIAEIAYGGRLGNGPPGSGDGFRFRGRGLIQLTGRENYTRFAEKRGLPLADLPALLETRSGAADSAGAFWASAGCNGPADAWRIDDVRLQVNGGLNGIAEVRDRYEVARAALGIR